MQKLYMNGLLRSLSMIVVSALSIGVISCDDDEAPQTSPDFSFEVSPNYKITAPTGIVVNFADKSQNVSAYSWNFGDGSEESTEASPSHLYRVPGKYTVELSTAAANGATPAIAKRTMEIDVVDPTSSLTNLVQGGGMETADESKWTKIFTGHKSNGVNTHVAGTFGSTKNKPANGTGGGFNVSVPTNMPDGGDAGSAWYQAITLTAGVYKFSADIKHDAETPAGATRSFKDYWYELYLGKEVPEDGSGYDYWSTSGLTGFFTSGWTGASVPANNKPWPATDGKLPHVVWFVPNPKPDEGPALMARKAGAISDDTGVMTLTGGTYYIVIKAGIGGGGGFGTNGITIDNVRLVKLQ